MRTFALALWTVSWPFLALAVESGSAERPAETRLEAAEILRRADEVRNPDLDYAVEVAILSRSPEGRTPERTSNFTMITRGRGNTLLLRRTPPVLADSVFLIAGGKHRALTPRGARSVELVEGRVIYGEIGGHDLARLDFSTGWTVQLLGEEKFEEDLCYKLELKGSGGAGIYTRVLYWITKSALLPRRLEYYGTRTGRLLHMARYENLQNTSLGLRPTRMVIEGGNPWEEIKILNFSNPRRVDTASVSFSEEGMLRFRDAATQNREPGTGTDVPIESILAALAAPSPAATSKEPTAPPGGQAPRDKS